MLRRLFQVSIIAITVLVSQTPAFAAFDYEQIFTVASNGSTTPKSVFSLDETPWVYIKLPGSLSGGHIDVFAWTDPFLNTEGEIALNGANEFWTSLTNWNSFKKPGEWGFSASTLFAFPNPAAGGGFTNFTVTPEPVSSSLFLLGGGALAISRLRKKKK